MNIQIIKKILSLLLIVIVYSNFIWEVYADRIIYTELPANTEPSDSLDINYWKERLDPIDRDAQEYILIRSVGLFVPIVSIDKNNPEYDSIQNMGRVDVNSYLENWALKIYNNNSSNIENIFWHSALFADAPGRFKTHFQKIINLDINTEIIVFTKINDTYIKNFYTATKSFETYPEDLQALNGEWEKILNLITCTPIWTADKRWIVQAEYVKTIDDFIPESPLELSVDTLNKTNHSLSVEPTSTNFNDFESHSSSGVITANTKECDRWFICFVKRWFKKFFWSSGTENTEKTLNITNEEKHKDLRALVLHHRLLI